MGMKGIQLSKKNVTHLKVEKVEIIPDQTGKGTPPTKQVATSKGENTPIELDSKYISFRNKIHHIK